MNLVLKNNSINLEILEEKHFKDILVATKDKRIWEFYIYDGSNEETYLPILKNFILEKNQGTRFPFVVVNNKKIIGVTTIYDVDSKNRKAEIGNTWILPEFWNTTVNLECKQSLLEFCFNKLNLSRVQLRTDQNNLRSQKAILKIGAKYEGLLRNDLIKENGTKRNSMYYSIIEEEWPETKEKIAEEIKIKKGKH